MAIYGYARISRKTQNIERQVQNITAAYPEAKITKEAWTGTNIHRPAFERLLSHVKSGDTIVFDSVSRMSRNAAEGVAAYMDLYGRGVELVFLKEPHINTATYRAALEGGGVPMTGSDVDIILKAVNEYLMTLAAAQIRIAFDQAEKEVMDLRQRTREGIREARKNAAHEGIDLQIGQRPGAKLHVKKADTAKDYILRHAKAFGGTLTDQECMTLAGVARNTYYKYKGELKEGRS